MSETREILVTNDDGFRARGIHVLAQMLREYGNVTVVAPYEPQSGKSVSLTLDKPLFIEKPVVEPAAEGLGIGSVILGLPKPAFTGDRADELRKRLQCPEGYDFVIAIALGYSTDMKEPHDLREQKISRIG